MGVSVFFVRVLSYVVFGGGPCKSADLRSGADPPVVSVFLIMNLGNFLQNRTLFLVSHYN